MTTISRTDKIAASIKKGLEISRRSTQDHIRNLQHIESTRVLDLKTAGSSCSTCFFFGRIRLTDVCCLMKKPVNRFAICHRHQKREGE